MVITCTEHAGDAAMMQVGAKEHSCGSAVVLDPHDSKDLRHPPSGNPKEEVGIMINPGHTC